MRTATPGVSHHSSAAFDTLSTRVAVPRTTERNALILQSNEVEYLSAGNQHGIDQVEVPALPQACDLARIELPQFFLIESVKPLDLQGCSVIQHDVEQDGRQQIQGQ